MRAEKAMNWKNTPATLVSQRLGRDAVAAMPRHSAGGAISSWAVSFRVAGRGRWTTCGRGESPVSQVCMYVHVHTYIVTYMRSCFRSLALLRRAIGGPIRSSLPSACAGRPARPSFWLRLISRQGRGAAREAHGCQQAMPSARFASDGLEHSSRL